MCRKIKALSRCVANNYGVHPVTTVLIASPTADVGEPVKLIATVCAFVTTRGLPVGTDSNPLTACNPDQKVLRL